MAHVHRRKNGTWLARYRGPEGREYSKAFARKVDAEAFAALVEADKLRGTWTDPRQAKIRYSDWHDEWWKTTIHLRASSRARDESYAGKHVLPRFGNMPLGRITQLEVRKWVAELMESGLAPSTVRLIYQVLSRAMSAAVDSGLIPTSPCRNLKLPRIEKLEMRFLSPDEVNELVGEVDEHHRTLVVVAAYLGMRWGELAGLKPGNVNLLKRTIAVTDQLLEVRGELSFGPPKTAAGRRVLSVPPFLVAKLDEQLARPVVVGSRLVFPSVTGEPMRRGNFRRRVWIPATRRAGKEGLRFHDLRHTAVALAIAMGSHPKSIQQRMGHSSIAVTLDRYGHLFPVLDERIADGLEDAFQQSVRMATGGQP